MQDENPATLLYVDCRPDNGVERRRLEGMRRYAAARGWRVETLDHKVCSPAALREALGRLRPIGCVAECWRKEGTFPPAAFQGVPVIYFGPPETPKWRDAPRVECDEAAVARMAFRELSAGKPSAYAVVSFWKERKWQRERIDAFRECCREAGFDCLFAYFPDNAAPRPAVPTRSLVAWAASLPPRCAVFAVNDGCAFIVADALARAGRSFPRTVTLLGADGQGAFRSEDMEIAPRVSSVVLDHEMAGYLAAKALGAFAANDDRRCAANELPATRAEPKPSLVFPPLLVNRRASTRGHGRREPRILEAMDMIRREACDGLTVAKLASRLPGSRSLLDIRFREAMGHSVFDEILQVRLERVFDLLRQPATPISAIADLSGFGSLRALDKLFRSRFGCSLRAWRKRYAQP